MSGREYLKSAIWIILILGYIPDIGRSFSIDRRSVSDEERLLSRLFYDYNKFARPRLDSTSTVTVTLQFSLMHIRDLDIRSQIFTTTGLLMLEWEDERLTWRPAEHNGMTEIIVEARSLWKPELAVINGAEKLYEEYNQFRAVIKYDGRVHWEPAGVFKTMCEIDITYYPFDEQRCELTFGSWSYHTGKMNLTSPTDGVNLDSYSMNGEWEVRETRAQRKEFSYSSGTGVHSTEEQVTMTSSVTSTADRHMNIPTTPPSFGNPTGDRFSSIAFAIQLRRRHLFYVMNVIMPSVMTSVLLLSVFFCTPAQKVQIGVVVLLSFRIFLLNVAENIPKTSDHVPLLVIYLTCTLVITTLSMVLTVLVLNLYGTEDHPVPSWIRDFLLIFVARVLGMCETARIYREAKDASNMAQRLQKARNGAGLNFFVRASLAAGIGSRRSTRQGHDDSPHAASATATVLELQPSSLNTPTTTTTTSTAGHDAAQHKDAGAGSTPSSHASAAVVSNDGERTTTISTPPLRNLVMRDGKSAASGPPMKLHPSAASLSVLSAPIVDYAKDWKRVAQIVDRLFFWLFLLAIVVSTLALFYPLTSLVVSRKTNTLIG